MYVKLAILLLSVLVVVSSQAQIPSPQWWIYDGDSLYCILPDVWVTGDSLHFVYAGIDSATIAALGAGLFEVDTLTVNDTLNVKGPGLFEEFVRMNKDLTVDSSLVVGDSSSFYDDVLVKNNLTIEDTTFCDYYMGLSPMHFLSSSYFTYLKADTIDALYQVAPSFSGTDYTNTEGYWNIIAGPDSLEWDITNNIYATTDDVLDFVIDETDTMYVFFQETANKSDYRLLRGTSVGWSSIGTIGTVASTCNATTVSMCQGGGDTLLVGFGNGENAQCFAVWDGSSFSAIDTVSTVGAFVGGKTVDIARESDGTIHYIGAIDNNSLGYWIGTFGSWSATDTVSITTGAARGAALVIDGSEPHVFIDNIASPYGINEYSSPTGGWNITNLWTGGNPPLVGDAAIDAAGVIYVVSKDHDFGVKVHSNDGGWAQVGGDLWSFNSTEYPHIALNSLGYPTIVMDSSGTIKVATWIVSAWDDISPATGDGAIVDLAFDSNDDVHIVTRNGVNNFLLYGTRQMDPGFNTGHRNGALLIRTNVQNDAADIYIKTDSTIHMECDTLMIEGVVDSLRVVGVFETDGQTILGDAPSDSLHFFTAGDDIVIGAFTRFKNYLAGSANLGPTAPTWAVHGTAGCLAFDADAELAFLAIHVPGDWNGSSDLVLSIYWTNQDGTAIGDTETVIWLSTYRSIIWGGGSAENIENGTAVSPSVTYTQSGAGVDGDTHSSAITIDYDHVDQTLAADDMLIMQLSRDMTTDTYGSDALVTHWCLEYTSVGLSAH